MRFTTFIYVLCLFVPSFPAWGQSNVMESCYIPSDPETGEKPIVINDCVISVTGNLWSSKAERTETMMFSRHIVTNDVERELGLVGELQQFRRSDSRSANPTSQGVTMRGLGGNAASRTLLFLDGIPQADPFGGWVAWPGYDALELVSIRLRRGAGQPSVGPGSIAGVIELDSRKIQGQSSFGLGFGSRNSVDALGRVVSRLGAGWLTVGASYSRSDGFIPVIRSQRGAVDHGAAYEQAGISIQATAPVVNDIDLQANVRAYLDNRNRGVDFSRNTNNGVDASLKVSNRKGGWQWSATSYVQLRDFSSEFGAVSVDRSTVAPTLDQFATPSNGMGLRVEIRPPLDEKWELRLGGEWRHTLGETRENFSYVGGRPTRFRTAGGDADTIGGFAELTLSPVEQFKVSAGGRYDIWRLGNGFRREVNIGGDVRSDDRFQQRENGEWSGRAGIDWEPLESFHVGASMYRSWRLPTLNELYRPFRVGADATAANAALSPERLSGFEFVSGYYSTPLTFEAVYFDNRLKGAIANVSVANGPGNFPGVGFVAAGGVYRQRQNLDAIQSRGLELYARVLITYSLDISATYSFIDAQVEASGITASLDGLRPAQVARHSGRIALTYNADDDRATFSIRHIGKQFEDDANSRALGAATVVDFAVAKEVRKNLFVELRGDNLLNTRVEAAISGAGIIERATPRTLWLGASWKFD
ncbi:MAG: TonB-dependent receptor [Sphingorhabdus sp.]